MRTARPRAAASIVRRAFSSADSSGRNGARAAISSTCFAAASSASLAFFSLCASCVLNCSPSACLTHSLSIRSASASTCSCSLACTSALLPSRTSEGPPWGDAPPWADAPGRCSSSRRARTALRACWPLTCFCTIGTATLSSSAHSLRSPVTSGALSSLPSAIFFRVSAAAPVRSSVSSGALSSLPCAAFTSNFCAAASFRPARPRAAA